MKRIIKQVLGLVIALSIIISGIPNVMAASVSEFKDFPTGWSKVAMEAAVNNGLLVGFEGNEIRPENYLTRAEMATIIVRAFGAKTKVDISGYTDVLPSAWYYEYIEKIVKMGAMKGVSSSRMAPDDYITREEVFTTVARVLVLEDSDYDALLKYNDYSEISSWAKGYMSALAKRGYVNGDELGNANPKDNITREEFAQFMHNAIKTYITKSGTYSNDMNGIVVVRAGNVTLNNLSLTSDLVIADGVMEESVNINNVNVEKRLLTRGGTIKLTKTTLGENVVVNNVNGITYFKNYRTENVFNGIVENTEASFLKQGAGGGSGVTPTPPPSSDEWAINFYDEKGDLIHISPPVKVKDGEKISQSIFNLVNVHCKKTGYTVHWYDGTEEVTKDTIINKDYDLHLVYKLIKYTIEYYDEKGTYIDKDEYDIENIPSMLVPTYPANKEFKGWYTGLNGTGTKIDSLTVTDKTSILIKVYMHLVDKGSTPTTYQVEFYEKEGDTTPVKTLPVNAGETIPQTAFDELNVIYKELGKTIHWRKNQLGTDYTSTTAINEYTKLYLYKEYVVYNVKLLNEDGNEFKTEWFKNVPSLYTYNVDTPYVLPLSADIFRLGYDFNGWYEGTYPPYITEVKVVDDSTVVSDRPVKADFDLITYKVIYHKEDGTVISGKDTEYNIEMASLPDLWSPQESDIPSDKLFSGWYTEINGGGYEVEDIPAISSNDIRELHLYMCLADKPTPPPSNKYTITFYKGYGDGKRFGGTIENVSEGSTIDESQYPATSGRRREVKYNKSIVDELFIDPGYVDYTYGTYWYVKGNQLLPFNDKVVINGNMDVYCLFKTFAPKITLSSYPDALLKLDLTYDDDTHMMTFTKNLGITAGDFLDKAIQMGQLPKYDEFKSKIEGLLLKSKLFDENKNIKVVNVPIPISKLIKQETAEDMIKQYIRDVINDSARLEEILSYVDIKDIIKGMSTEEFVASFTDKELLDIIKDPTNRDKIIKVVKDDVAKDGSVMLTPIVNYIKDNPTLISDDVIKEISDKEAESDLKTFVIGHLKTELNTDGSTLQTKIVSVINTELKDPDSDISKTILKYVKENLGKDTTQGAELRKMIINSSKLNDILNESGVKEEAIKFMLKDSFIDSMFANDAARKELLKTVVDNDTFLATLVESEEFISYIVDRLHEHQDGDIGKDIENLLESETSKFREHLLEEVKDNDDFKKLLKDNTDLQKEIKDSVAWEDYITSDDKLLQYLFNQPGASNAGFEEFVTAAVLKKVEDKMEEQWNLKYPSNPYDGLTDVQKQDCKDELYLEEAYRTEVLNVAKSEFNTYKDKVINDLINGTKITDSGINKIINDLMVLYIEDYIELIPIFPTNNALNNEVYKTIEKILVHEVQILVKDGITDDDMEAELTTLFGHITTMKNTFVDEDDADIIADMKKLVKKFKQDNYSTMNGIITAEYSTLVTELVKLVQQVPVDLSMYNEVDSTIKTVASLIKDSSISTFMVNLANDPVECKKLILQYVKSLDDAGISNLVADYIDMNNDNKTAVKDEIDNILKTEDITSEVKKYVSLGSADTTISKFIDNGITEQFIHDNRTAIEEALLNVDISAFVTVEIVKEYVEGLETTEEKKEFADKVYKSLTSSEIFSTFMDSLMNKDTFEVNSENVNIIELFRQAIEDLDFNEALKNMNNATLEKIFDSIGRDKFTGIFDRVKYEYTDGLEIVINNVKATGNKANYKTSLKLSVDPLNEVLVGLYEKGQDKVVEKLSEKMPYYNENPYLKGLIEHDVVSYLFDYDPAMKNDVYTGYKLKDNYMDYYDYMLSLFITADQAIQWFKVNGEGGFDEDEFKVLYDSVFGKIDYAYDKVNELLIDYSKDGKLPSQIKEILEKVQRVNEIFVNNEGKLKNVIDKYLDSELYIEGNIGDEERVVKMVDILLSQEDPAVTLDTVYSIFYNGTDKVRAKLQELIDSGKLEKAMNKFEETEIGKLMTDKGLGSVGDKITEIENTGKLESAVSSLYDLLIVFAEKGLEPFKVDKDVITVVDSYLFNVGQLSFQVSRKLM